MKRWFSDKLNLWWLFLLAILSFVGFWVGIFPRHREALRGDPEFGGKWEIPGGLDCHVVADSSSQSRRGRRDFSTRGLARNDGK
ncbi:MAG: hypothetical protein EOM19_08360 [Candidatus Moranbacteria bacterium]|nr:hypothetical protein [Candidatus Moranbacteria bacterium]